MTDHIKMLIYSTAMLALLLMTGCSDSPEAVEQPKPLTKQDIEEVIEEASQPGQFTKDAMEAYEADRDRVKAQTKGYVGEEWEQKKIKAQKEYEEFQKKQAQKEAQKNKQVEKP